MKHQILTEELRQNVRDLFLANQLHAERTSSLLGDAAAAGIEALEDVKNIQAKGSKNVHREGAKQWPDLYWSKVDVWDKKKQKVKRGRIAVLLPHEWLCELNSKVPSDSLTTSEGLGPKAAPLSHHCLSGVMESLTTGTDQSHWR